MNVSFDILFTVLFSHSYFTDKKLRRFKVVPFQKTAAQLLNLGLIFKSYDDGFAVLYDRQFSGSVRTRDDVIKLKKTLQFCLYMEDALFLSYTTGLADFHMDSSVLYFTNTWAEKNAGQLHKQDHAEKSTIKNNVGKSASGIQDKPFGFISINLGKITDGNYFVRFKTKATIWRYVLATDFLQALENPAIINKEDNSFFSGPAFITLPNKKQATVFTSKDSIELSDRSGKKFQLVENFNPDNGKYKVVLQQLPYPDVSRFSVIDETADRTELVNYSEIII